MFKKTKTPVLDLVGYEVIGTAYLTLWGGEKATIPMRAVKIYKVEDITEQDIIEAINDNGFGCESINSADVVVREIWQLVRNGHIAETMLMNYRKTYNLNEVNK